MENHLPSKQVTPFLLASWIWRLPEASVSVTHKVGGNKHESLLWNCIFNSSPLIQYKIFSCTLCLKQLFNINSRLTGKLILVKREDGMHWILLQECFLQTYTTAQWLNFQYCSWMPHRGYLKLSHREARCLKSTQRATESGCLIWRWDLQPEFTMGFPNSQESIWPPWHGIQNPPPPLARGAFIAQCNFPMSLEIQEWVLLSHAIRTSALFTTTISWKLPNNRPLYKACKL